MRNVLFSSGFFCAEVEVRLFLLWDGISNGPFIPLSPAGKVNFIYSFFI